MHGAALSAPMLEAAIEASHVSVTVADMTAPDAPLCFVNQAFLETTGYARQDVVGRNCRFLQGPDTDPAAVRAMRAAIDAGEPLRIDVLNYRKDGAPFWNALQLSPIRASDGGVCAYIGIQNDVTEARAAREAEQQRQRIEALGRMAGGLAHELNNMLQPLLTLPDLVAEALPETAHEAREDLSLMVQSAREARDLVADMLGYARVAPGDGAALDAADSLSRALSLIERSLHGAVTIRQEVRAEGIGISGLSHGGLQQILTNLILNASDAMDRRGEIVVTLSRGGRAGARLEVADTGCGMDEVTRSRLFEPFFTTKPVGQGAGLGLHVVFDLVQHAGGTITVESAPGKGARFILDFPPA
jgi:PAS domain S-box-containing protein